MRPKRSRSSTHTSSERRVARESNSCRVRTDVFYDAGMISGMILREARRRAGLSQAALGRRVGRPQTQIARWERGAVLPSLETLRELVRACGLDVTIGLAAYDDSYVGDTRERLALAPRERMARAVAAANAARALRGERPHD